MTNQEAVERLCGIIDCVGEQYHDGVAEVLLTDGDIEALKKLIQTAKRFDVLKEDFKDLKDYVVYLEDTVMFYETYELEN